MTGFEHLPENIRAICEGRRPDLSPEQIAAYAAYCAKESGEEITGRSIGRFDESGDPAPPPMPPGPALPGPGTELKEIFESLEISVHGVQTNGCAACRDLMDRMNALGPAGCRTHAEAFSDELRDRAKAFTFAHWAAAAARTLATGLVFKINPLDPFPGLIAEAIRRAESKLDQESPNSPVSLQNDETAPPEGSGNVPDAPESPRIDPVPPVAQNTVPAVASHLRWSYGVTTTPKRRETLLPETLRSLAAAGFDDPLLGVDGEDDLAAYRRFGLDVTCRSRPGYNFANWFLTALEVYLRDPFADRYAIFEDDLLISRGARDYLERTTGDPQAYFNLFTNPGNHRRLANRPGWGFANQRGEGAVGLVFPHNAFRELLSNPGLLLHAQNMTYRQTDGQWSAEITAKTVINPARGVPVPRGQEYVDGLIVSAMSQSGRLEFCHAPSIVQHVGNDNASGHGKFPGAPDWRGEEFDMRTLL